MTMLINFLTECFPSHVQFVDVRFLGDWVRTRIYSVVYLYLPEQLDGSEFCQNYMVLMLSSSKGVKSMSVYGTLEYLT